MGPMGISTLDPVYIGLSTQADGKQLTVPDSHASLPIPAETPSCPGPPPPACRHLPQLFGLALERRYGRLASKGPGCKGLYITPKSLKTF